MVFYTSKLIMLKIPLIIQMEGFLVPRQVSCVLYVDFVTFSKHSISKDSEYKIMEWAWM